MEDRTPEGYLDWMRESNPNIVHIELIDDERWVMIERLMYHYTIKTGTVNDFFTGYEDRWCIANLQRALISFAEWKTRGFEGEPTLWHRHPNSGRRRDQDNPVAATEHIAQ